MQVGVLSSRWCTIPWFPRAERDLRGFADSRVCVLYKGRKQRPENLLGNVQKFSILHI